MKNKFNETAQKRCYEIKLTGKAAKKSGYEGMEKKILKFARQELGREFLRIQPLLTDMKKTEKNTKVFEIQEARSVMLAVQKKFGKNLKSITHTGTAVPSFKKSKRAYQWKGN